MTVIWSSLLIIALYIFRKKLLFVEACSVTGIISIYLFCALRLLLPIELPWTRVINGGLIWNGLQRSNGYEFLHLGKCSITLGEAFLFLWIVIAVYKCIRIMISYINLKKIVSKIPKEKVENPIAIGEGIEVYKSECVNNPCAIGIREQIILFPNRDYSKQQENYIVMHEIAHHKNKDILIKLFTNVLCALYWWNPFVYLLKKDINQSLEIRCDQKVTQCLEKDKRAEYLTIILEEFRNSVGVKSNQNEYMMEMAGHEDDALVERFQLVANGGYCTFLWKRIVIAVSFFMIFIASYSFVIQSSFDLPASEIEDGTYLYDESNSYILHHHDGTYHLVTPYETLKLNEDQVQFYLNEGFALKEQ
jgi:beta-lactamase regulating signal transducer with metallopeptidase domain